MSYSNLVSYVKLSPNCTKPRNHGIDRITIHCVVGQVSVESLGAVFAKEARQASANYGIGTDGRIACFVEEENRSWCSGDRENDHRAITIEVASDLKPPYAVNDKAFAALLDLCEDICRRHGIVLNYTGDRSGNMTLHKWFQNTDCPGEFLESRQSRIAEEVNRRLGAEKAPEKELNMRLLKNGCKGEDVRALQILLIGRGYTCGSWGADGDFGNATELAVRNYQQDHGLDADRIAGPVTMGSLLGVTG